MAAEDRASGWARTAVTTGVGIVALIGSTYTVVSKITTFENTLMATKEQVSTVSDRVTVLERAQLPAGLEQGRLAVMLGNIERSLARIEKRMDDFERKNNEDQLQRR